jgi:hypothetical protein
MAFRLSGHRHKTGLAFFYKREFDLPFYYPIQKARLFFLIEEVPIFFILNAFPGSRFLLLLETLLYLRFNEGPFRQNKTTEFLRWYLAFGG